MSQNGGASRAILRERGAITVLVVAKKDIIISRSSNSNKNKNGCNISKKFCGQATSTENPDYIREISNRYCRRALGYVRTIIACQLQRLAELSLLMM